MSVMQDWPELEDLDQVTAWDYLRVSLDESGVKRSNTEQHTENVEVITRKRWKLAETFEDVGSASKYARKRRPGFDELVARLKDPHAPVADVLVLWEPSRGSREVDVWFAFLKLCQRRGVRIFVTTLRRLFLPWISSDWGDLMRLAVKAAEESMQIAERVGRSTKADAKSGHVPGGRRAFGYEATGGVINEVEAAVVRECVRRVLAGETVRSIAADLNRRGIKTTAGNSWHPGPLRNMISGTRIAAIRTHNGVVVAKGTWPAIIDEDTHRRVLATLSARTPVGRRGRTPWLLTGLLRCDRCERPLVSNTDIGGTRRYACRKAPGYHGCGGLSIKAEPLEELLGDLVTERLADVEARRAATVTDDDTGEIAELSRISAQRIEIADARATKGMPLAAALEEYAALDRLQRTVEARLAAKVRESAPLDFVAAEGYVGRRWDDLELDEQRIILGALVDHVTVAPASVRGSTAFEYARVTEPGRIVWKA